MSAKAAEIRSLASLERRFRSRLPIGLSLARAYRFVAELEPAQGEEPDPFVALASDFQAWRQALRDEDPEAALDAVERTWSRMEACQKRIIERDASIQAYRVRWACENAPLRYQTIDSLARLYRVQPFSTTSQSKYEYVLTRRLAGPIGPERRLAPTEELIDAVKALEISWGALPVTVPDGEVSTIFFALKSFAHEASGQADAASFTASALLRRFGAFKASLGEKLFEPRLSVCVVETNVAVLNVLNQLLTDAGGRPMQGTTEIRRPRFLTAGQAPPVSVPEVSPLHTRPDPRSGEIDISALEVIRPSGAPFTEGQHEAGAPAPGSPTLAAETPPALNPRLDLKTGEVDLSGLEFVRRIRRRYKAGLSGAESEDAKGDEDSAFQDEAATQDIDENRSDTGGPAFGSPSEGDAGASDRAPAAQTTAGDSPDEEAGQQPSLRAFELGKLAENAPIIQRYLAWPRSPEVWQLNLDVFLGESGDEALNSKAHAPERRRALELILAADDLICMRTTQEGAPSAEHRAKVKSVANAMLLLRTSLRRVADLAPRDSRQIEPLFYIADHLLWERLRLESSLKRNARRKRPPILPRATRTAEAILVRARLLKRHRRILVRIVGVAVALTAVVSMFGSALPSAPVDKDVNLVELRNLPGVQLFDEARSFKQTLFVSASATWLLLRKEERRSLVRALGAFGAERGFDTISVIGPKGETWASFYGDEVTLDEDLTAVDLAGQ